jgi:hypothetical protein
MPESLLFWYTTYIDSPAETARKLKGKPVFVYEPNQNESLDGEDEDDDFQFRTRSGITSNTVGGGEPLAIPIEKIKSNGFMQKITLGRTSNNDIILDDASVSRFHAWVEEVSGVFYYADAGSRNGSLVDGKRIEAKVKIQLKNGTKLRVGSVELIFYVPDEFFKMLKRRGEPSK